MFERRVKQHQPSVCAQNAGSNHEVGPVRQVSFSEMRGVS